MAVRLRIKGDEDVGNWFNNDENRSWGFPRNHLPGLKRATMQITIFNVTYEVHDS
jgi:nuclear transport factor 2 (NTF2) superfamily protein